MNTSVSGQIRIDYDDDQLNTVEKINKALKEHGLVLVDDGLVHDGYCIFTLQAINTDAAKQDRWLVECVRCSRPKAPLGCTPVNDAEVKDYCMPRECSGYAEWPYASRLPDPQERP